MGGAGEIRNKWELRGELYLLPYVMSNMPKASRIAGEPSLVLGQLNGDE